MYYFNFGHTQILDEIIDSKKMYFFFFPKMTLVPVMQHFENQYKAIPILLLRSCMTMMHLSVTVFLLPINFTSLIRRGTWGNKKPRKSNQFLTCEFKNNCKGTLITNFTQKMKIFHDHPLPPPAPPL